MTVVVARSDLRDSWLEAAAECRGVWVEQVLALPCLQLATPRLAVFPCFRSNTRRRLRYQHCHSRTSPSLLNVRSSFGIMEAPHEARHADAVLMYEHTYCGCARMVAEG